MLSINFNNPGKDVHHCVSFKEGDWIYFSCPKCKEVVRKINWKTGNLELVAKGNTIRHMGFHAPVKVTVSNN